MPATQCPCICKYAGRSFDVVLSNLCSKSRLKCTHTMDSGMMLNLHLTQIEVFGSHRSLNAMPKYAKKSEGYKIFSWESFLLLGLGLHHLQSTPPDVLPALGQTIPPFTAVDIVHPTTCRDLRWLLAIIATCIEIYLQLLPLQLNPVVV